VVLQALQPAGAFTPSLGRKGAKVNLTVAVGDAPRATVGCAEGYFYFL
jgi:hypothetical protein